MNILKYTKDQMQHRKKLRKHERKQGLEKSYYEYKAKTDLHYVHVLLKMDLRRKIPTQLNKLRNKIIKKKSKMLPDAQVFQVFENGILGRKNCIQND